MPTSVLGTRVGGGDVVLNVERLVVSRMLLQANSGAGKSWALRRILEQTHGRLQHLVLDVEDEFHTLRERFDYVLAGRHGGDCPADVRSAELLARRLLELGVSAIIGIFELQPPDRKRFVRLFLESLINAPRELWHPVLVVVDEADVFCPEDGKAESAGAVVDLEARGRKRGFCGILATQRIAKLSKDAAAECNNKLIGRCGLDVDMKRAAYELGLSAREDQHRLRSLQPGEFFAFGPALSDTVVQVMVGPVETTHPKAGQRSAPPAPPREKVQKVLAQLADLPREAEEQRRSVAELAGRVRELERELRAARAAAPRPPAPQQIRVEVPVLRDKDLARLEALVAKTGALGEAFRDGSRTLAERLASAGALGQGRGPAEARIPVAPAPRPTVAAARAASGNGSSPPAPPPGVEDLTGPEQRILDAVAWLETIGVGEPELAAVAFLSGYTHGGGAFNNPKGALRRKGLVDYVAVGRIHLTEKGRGLAHAPEASLTVEEMHKAVMERLPGPEQRVLAPLLKAYPEDLSYEALAAAAGYREGGGAFNNPRGRLRTLGLIEYPRSRWARARRILFLED